MVDGRCVVTFGRFVEDVVSVSPGCPCCCGCSDPELEAFAVWTCGRPTGVGLVGDARWTVTFCGFVETLMSGLLDPSPEDSCFCGCSEEFAV